MGFGKLRFRRSFGQVKSQFRGAIPKHFPLVQNLLDLYPATAAYSAYDLGNKRGAVTETEGGTRYVVSGAGTAAVNGEYVENGLSANGNKAYTLYSNGAVAFNMWSYGSTGWLITSSAVDSSPVFEDIYYEELTASTTPPALLSAAFSGALPTPTVASLTTRTVVNPVQRWRRGSDDALQMFTAAQVAGGTALDFVVPTDVQALYSNTMYFDGTNDYVSIGTGLNTATNGDTAFTLQADITTTATGVNADIIANGNTSTFAGFNFRMDTSNQLRFTIGNTSSNRINVITTGVTINDGAKHTIRLDYDGTKTAAGVTFTIDGVVASKSVATDAMTVSVVPTQPITIGARDGGASLFWDGTITDVTVATSTYVGDGNANSNWLDTSVNTNNGTVGGAPALFTGQGYDAYLLTEYDQSGNDYDLTQTTAANQPLVVSGGALTVDSLGNVAPDFDGVNDSLSSSLVPPLSCTMMGVAEFDVVGSTCMIIGARDATSQRSYIAATSSSDISIGAGGGAFGTVTPVVGETYLITGSYSGTSVNCAVDGVNETGTQAAPVNATHGYSLGALNDAGTDGSFMDGHITAVLVYDTDQTANRAQIEAKLSTIVTTAIS